MFHLLIFHLPSKNASFVSCAQEKHLMPYLTAIFEVENGAHCSYISKQSYSIEKVQEVFNTCYEHLHLVQIDKNIFKVSTMQLQAYIEEVLNL
jgi:hypothetical protein